MPKSSIYQPTPIQSTLPSHPDQRDPPTSTHITTTQQKVREVEFPSRDSKLSAISRRTDNRRIDDTTKQNIRHSWLLIRLVRAPAPTGTNATTHIRRHLHTRLRNLRTLFTDTMRRTNINRSNRSYRRNIRTHILLTIARNATTLRLQRYTLRRYQGAGLHFFTNATYTMTLNSLNTITR